MYTTPMKRHFDGDRRNGEVSLHRCEHCGKKNAPLTGVKRIGRVGKRCDICKHLKITKKPNPRAGEFLERKCASCDNTVRTKIPSYGNYGVKKVCSEACRIAARRAYRRARYNSSAKIREHQKEQTYVSRKKAELAKCREVAYGEPTPPLPCHFCGEPVEWSSTNRIRLHDRCGGLGG